MGEQRRLDFGRPYVDAAGDDEVGPAVGEIEITVGVEMADVADRFPTIHGRAPLRADVAIARAGTARRHREDFTLLAGRQVLAAGALDANAGAAGRASDRTGALQPFAA